MFLVAIKSLLGHKLRMLLTLTSIVIGVSFVAGTYIFTDSMSSTFDTLFDDVFTSIDVTVRPREAEFGSQETSLDSSILEVLKSVEGIDKTEPSIDGNAQIIARDGELIGGNGPPTLGFSWTKTESLNPLTIKEGNGRPPEKAGEVIIDINSAKTGDFKIGDTLSIQTEGPIEEFTLVGIASFGDADSLAGATLSAFEFKEAQRLFSLGGGFSDIGLKAISGLSPDDLKQRVDLVLPEGTESVTGDQQKNEELKEINESLGFITTALLAFAGIAIFVGSFIIQNTFRIVVSQRSKELALLRAIGATRRQVISLVLYEAIVVALFASAIGIGIGVLLSNGLQALGNSLGFGLPDGELTLLPRTVYIAMTVGVVVTLLSALFPAIKASKVSPVEAMSDNEASAPRKSLKKRAFAGLAITGLGAAALLQGLFGSTSQALALVGTGVGVIFLGVSTLAPLLSKPLATIIGWPVQKYYGVIGKIATENTKRIPRRTAATAAALMIGVSLVVLVSIFASSIKATIDTVLEEQFPGDIVVSVKGGEQEGFNATFSPEIALNIDDLDEISLVSQMKYDIVKIEDSEELVIAIEPSEFSQVFALKPSGGSYGLLTENSVYVNKSIIESGKAVGDVLEVEYAETGKNTLTITGTFEEDYDSPYLISATTYASNFSNEKDLYLVANVANGTDLEDAQAAIDKALEPYPTVQSQDKSQLAAQISMQIDQLLGLMSALLGFAVVIAVLGITNTLTLSVSERTREIGMLRAIGMTKTQVRKMIRGEAVIIAVFGAALGVAMGVFFGWALLKALESEGFTDFSVPVAQIAVYLVLSAAAGVIAAILPSIKASRMNILDAINRQ